MTVKATKFIFLTLLISAVLFVCVNVLQSKTKWYNQQYDEYMRLSRFTIETSEHSINDDDSIRYATQSIAYSNLAREIRESEGK